MNRTKKHKKDAAAHARQGRLCHKPAQSISPDIPAVHIDSDSNFEGKRVALPVTHYVPNSDEECDWNGTVNYCPLGLSDSDFEWTDSESESDTDDETEYSELEGEGLVESLQKSLEEELKSLKKLTPYETLKQDINGKIWKKAEQNRGFGYNGKSDRTKRHHTKKVRDKEEEDKIKRKS